MLVAWQLPAHAEPAVCKQLRQQLSGKAGGSGSREIQQASRQLAQLRGRSKAQGCSVLFPRDAAQCSRIKREIGALSDRLSLLRRGEGAGSAGSRRQVLAAMDANGCGGSASRGQRTERQQRSFLDVLFGRRENREATPVRQPPRAAVNSGPEQVSTTNEGTDPTVNALVKKGYRTVCVRMCDGYYFPISFSSKPGEFGRDQKVCSAMCPGAEARLYFHTVPDEESDAMISVADNKPYAALPNAFNYRTAGATAVPGCGCRQALTYRRSPTEPLLKVEEEQGDAAGEVPAEPVAELTVAPGPLPPDEREVRIVGPTFLAEGGSIDLRKPTPDIAEPESPRGIITPENIVNVIVTDIRRRLQ
jgi:hypothetical protein